MSSNIIDADIQLFAHADENRESIAFIYMCVRLCVCLSAR